VGYQPSGAVSSYTTGINTGKNVTTTVLLDASLLPRPSQIYATAQATGLRPFDTQSYAYDGAGNIKTIGADTFAYDNRSRLTNATYSGLSSQVYSYDRYGNLLSKGPTNYSVSAFTNRLTSATYDSRGNVTGNGGETYGYDGLDRQTTHTAGGSSWYYLHDGGNERVAKVPPAGGAWTYTFRDEGNRVATEYAGTTVSRDNVFLGSLAVVSYANEAVGGNGAAWTFYSSDHLGTPRLVTDLSGNAIETRKSWPYGEDATTPGAFQRLRFALMERDTEGSKYYDHARSHDFALGRFVSPDKVGGRIVAPQTWNRYAYARSNPLKFVDPDGNVAVGFIGAGNAQDSGVVKIVGLVNNAPGIGRALAVNHESVGNAVKFIQGQHATNPSEAVVLFGHSKGVDSALEVSAALKGKGIKVDLVITIDPVFGDKTAPSNVSRAVNYFQSGMDLGGGQIRPESSSTSVTNVSVPGVGHTTIDEAVVDRSVTQIRSLGASRVPEPAPACGSPEFIGPCGR
jgi:RHS repeat-associated protein